MRTLIALLVALATLTVAAPSHAYPQFNVQWMKLYAKEHPDKEFADYLAKEVKCWSCHQGKSKKHHNPYGIHFVGKLGKDDRRDVAKMLEVLKEVGAMHSDPKDDSSPTYAELLEQSKLPGGSLEDCKKEPPKE